MKWKRRLLRYGLPAVVVWLAASHFLARPALESWLRKRFLGEPGVAFAIFWPHFAVTGFGVHVEAEHHVLHASRVHADLSVWSLFGARLVKSATITSLRARFAEGEELRLLRTAEEGDSAGEDANVDPARMPPLRFEDPEIRLDSKRAFSTTALVVEQTGDRVLDVTVEAGVVAGIPFEKLTGQIMRRGDRLLLGSLKVRAFNGLLSGFIDIDTTDTGEVNGELECYAVETRRVWLTYDLPYAEKRRGDLSGSVIFKSTGFSLDALRGKGKLKLDRGEFFSPLSFKVFLVLKVPSAEEAPIHRAELDFSFENGILFLERSRAYARDFHLDARGLMTFAGQVDLEVRHAGTTVAIRGTIEDPDVTVLPLDYITLPFDRLFRERIKGR